MKIENEPGFTIQTPPRKSYNPFESDDEDTNDLIKSNTNGYHITRLEENVESLTFHLDGGDLSWEEALLVRPPISSPATPADARDDDGLYRKDTELFTDKTVTECEVPELMVCLKDNAYHSIKDIIIDEGVPANEKVGIKNGDNHLTEDLSTLSGDTNCDVTLGDDHEALKSIEGRKSRSGDDLENDASIQERSKVSMKDDGFEDSIKVRDSKHELGEKEFNSSLESGRDETKPSFVVYGANEHQSSEMDEVNNSKVEKKENEIRKEDDAENNVTLGNAEESSGKPSISTCSEATLKSIEPQSQSAEEASPQSSVLPATQEPAGTGAANVFSNDDKVEEMSRQNEAFEKPPETQTMCRDDEASLGGITVSSTTDKRVHEETATSFWAGMPHPSSITYMGSVPHPGSISLRSESSAGSTRSFAFPVLQTEWNSSPVRMAKAEQKRFHKHKGWIDSLMCCRF